MRGIVSIALLLVVLTGIGCYPHPKMPEGYTHKIQKQFHDIAIFPGDYEYLAHRSFTYVLPGSESFRIARFVAVGDTRVDEVVRFYETQMDLHDFKLVGRNEYETVHKVELIFEKEDEGERCTVAVSREGAAVCIEINLK